MLVPQSSYGGVIFRLMGPEPMVPKTVPNHRLEQFKRPVERFEFGVILTIFGPGPMLPTRLSNYRLVQCKV